MVGKGGQSEEACTRGHREPQTGRNTEMSWDSGIQVAKAIHSDKSGRRHKSRVKIGSRPRRMARSANFKASKFRSPENSVAQPQI